MGLFKKIIKGVGKVIGGVIKVVTGIGATEPQTIKLIQQPAPNPIGDASTQMMDFLKANYPVPQQGLTVQTGGGNTEVSTGEQTFLQKYGPLLIVSAIGFVLTLIVTMIVNKPRRR